MPISRVGVASLVALVVTTGAHAQSGSTVPPRRFGIELGGNSSTFGGSDASGSERRTGFLAGALAVLPFSTTIAFEPELVYSMKGANAHDPQDASISGTVKIGYLQIPALMRFELAAATVGPHPFLYAGPALGFKTSCSFELHAQGFNVNSSCDDLETGGGGKINSTDFSLIGGAGIAFNMSGRTVGLALRYDHSLTKIADQGDLKHRVISLLATIEFPGGR
ncbi:MAG TPA: porin family protein [Gemmatimonadaceae bacterium]|jgi:hypothetical protein|nr:porin family protein [Gemmatimonadaceae bacterium]